MKSIKIVFIILISIGFAMSCKKADEETYQIEFSKTTVDSVTSDMVKVTTSLTCPGGKNITQHGHCISLQQEPSIYSTCTILGKITQPGKFTSNFNHRDPNRKYYVRAYATCEEGTVYSEQIEVTTPDE